MAFQATHVVPQGGIPAWNEPDGSQPVAANLHTGTELEVVERRGDWARVTASNGWVGWVDSRRLVDRGAAHAASQTAALVTPHVPQGAKTNGFAIASMVLGIVWVYWIGSILALVFGYIGKRQIDESHGTQTGRGMAIAGIVLGWVGVGILLAIILAAIIAAGIDDA